MSSPTSEQTTRLHYSVTRGSTRRDPHLIICHNSDGDPSKWRETGPTVDNTGATCHWKADDQECQVLADKWKKTLGKTLAKLLGLVEDATDEDWRIQDFPKNYKLYRHVKGTREDYYLFGSEWVTKFRTANEFSPHFHWLCTYEPTKANRIYCKCKYCTGSKHQAHVNSSLGINDNSKRFSSPIFDQKSASQNKRKAEEEMAKENMRKRMASETKPPRIPQKPLQSRKPIPNHASNSVSNGLGPGRRSTFSGPYVNKDRDRDLSELKCTFRLAELVWCQLDTPIDGTKEGRPDLRIDYWPAICEERVLVSSSQVSTLEPSPDDRSSGRSSTLSLKVQQKFRWKVRLLATSDVYCKDESHLLAYLNYPPPLNIYKLPIKSENLKYIHDGHESDRPTIGSFSTFAEALTPFALSLQITAHIKKTFTLMDRYDIALLKRLEARGQNIPAEDVQILYEDANLPWYQYIWWGAEKIWSGELIRLIVTASDLPTGLRSIPPDERSRCFFLKVTGFYRSAQEEGMVKGLIFMLSPNAQREKDEAERDPAFEDSDAIPGLQHIKRYMPQPPNGFFFRRLTPIGKEHHLVLQHIAGRYYPPRHPIAVDQPEYPAPFSIDGRSLILSGMGEGRWLHMHCETWAIDRKECFKEAEASAERELLAFCEKSDEKIKTKSVTVVESEPETGEGMETNEAPVDEDVVMESVSVAGHPAADLGAVEKAETLVESCNPAVVVVPNPPALIDPHPTNGRVVEENNLGRPVTPRNTELSAGAPKGLAATPSKNDLSARAPGHIAVTPCNDHLTSRELPNPPLANGTVAQEKQRSLAPIQNETVQEPNLAAVYPQLDVRSTTPVDAPTTPLPTRMAIDRQSVIDPQIFGGSTHSIPSVSAKNTPPVRPIEPLIGNSSSAVVGNNLPPARLPSTHADPRLQTGSVSLDVIDPLFASPLKKLPLGNPSLQPQPLAPIISPIGHPSRANSLPIPAAIATRLATPSSTLAVDLPRVPHSSSPIATGAAPAAPSHANTTPHLASANVIVQPMGQSTAKFEEIKQPPLVAANGSQHTPLIASNRDRQPGPGADPAATCPGLGPPSQPAGVEGRMIEAGARADGRKDAEGASSMSKAGPAHVDPAILVALQGAPDGGGLGFSADSTASVLDGMPAWISAGFDGLAGPLDPAFHPFADLPSTIITPLQPPHASPGPPHRPS